MSKTKPTYEMLEEKIKFLESSVALMDSLKSEIKLNNSFLEVLFNAIPNPIFYKDKEGVYQNCNDAFSKTILGIPSEEIVGKSLYEFPGLIPKKLADIYYNKDQELINHPGSQSYESQVKCSDGMIRHYNFYKATFMSDSQEVLGVVGVMLDISDYKKTLDKLAKRNKLLDNMSITDSLTKVHNRRYFDEVFKKKITLLSRYKQKFALMIIDVDFFKKYNDHFGHHSGDNTLQSIAQTIEKSFSRENDYIFRLGGEEFGALFHFNEDKEAVRRVEEFIQNIENLKIEAGITTASPYVTVSAGLSILKGIKCDCLASAHIYNETDKLLYHSKKKGRNQLTYKIYEPYKC